MIDQTSDFEPDWTSPPGDTINDWMEECDWDQAKLAKRLGYSTKHLNQLLKGKAPLCDDTALRLECVIGSTARFWLNREAYYRVGLVRLEAQQRYEEWVYWLEMLPLPWLKKVGAIPDRPITKGRKPESVKILLQFFRVASPTEWTECYESLQGSFRGINECNYDIGSLTSWLQLGEIETEKMEVSKFSKTKFEKALDEIRELTVLPPHEFEPQLRALCCEAGVKLVFVPAVPKSYVSGAARWLNLHSPLIQLSLYGKTNDKFWFTFFRQTAHILLHADNKENIFLEYPDIKSSRSEQEREADQWATNKLIPEGEIADLMFVQTLSDVEQFAKSINIHPGIVVGRLQHEGKLKYAAFNELKEKLELTDSVIQINDWR